MEYVDFEDYFVWRLGLKEGVYLEGSVEVGSYPIVHHDEFTLRRQYFESFVSEELVVLHRFVEVAIIEHNGAGSVGLC